MRVMAWGQSRREDVRFLGTDRKADGRDTADTEVNTGLWGALGTAEVQETWCRLSIT